jgi:hypothetical protein
MSTNTTLFRYKYCKQFYQASLEIIAVQCWLFKYVVHAAGLMGFAGPLASDASPARIEVLEINRLAQGARS